MEIINDQHNVTAVLGRTERVPSEPVMAIDLGPETNAAEKAGIIITDEPEKSLETSAHYAEIDLDVSTSRIRGLLVKARGIIGQAIGNSINKTREFLTPRNRKAAVAGGLGAVAAGTAIMRFRSHSQ